VRSPLLFCTFALFPAHNFAWGGEDGRTLYLCARSALYRVQLMIPGVRP
jgi:hypothetical protein